MNLDLILDTETSGLPDWNLFYDDITQPWVVQLVALLGDEAQIYASLNLVIRSDGREITPEAALIHGYTPGRCDFLGINEWPASQIIAELADRASLVVSHNVDFDRFCIAGMLSRHYAIEKPERFLARSHFCTMKGSTDLCQLPGKHGYKWPKLEELYRHLFGEAAPIRAGTLHDAYADATAVRRCFYELRRRGLVNQGDAA